MEWNVGNSNDTTQLARKVAIVTGASSGIGRANARTLAAAGACVVLVGRDEARLTAVADSLSTETLVLAGDVASTDFVSEVVASAVERWKRIDILLSNAGLYLEGLFADADLSAVARLLEVNVFAAIAVVRETLPHMLAARSGDIILTSSIAGRVALHGEPIYSASKHAIQAFVHTVRRQLVGSGVRLGEIAPGVVLNELWGIRENEDCTSQIEGGTGIRSEDVADAVMFMLTRPRHVTVRDLVILPTSQDI